MSIKLYDLDKQGDYEEYKRKEADMKKNRNYSNMYKTGDEEKENLQNESTPKVEENKSAEPEPTPAEKKPEIYAGNLAVSPNTKGEVVNVDNLRVRMEPNTDAEIICTIPKKSIVNVLSKTDTRNPWYEIEKKTNKGYIHGHVMGEYLDVYVDG